MIVGGHFTTRNQLRDHVDPAEAPGRALAARRRVLMIAFQFPPYGQSTGRLRTLGFVRNLPAHEWEPIVLTGRETLYPEIDPSSRADVPPQTVVIRAAGMDVGRFFAVRGVYPKVLATPDRWNTWAIGSVFAGLAAIRKYRPEVLWATFPIPSALLAGLILRRFSGIPLIADLRDPMVYETWPATHVERAVYTRLERAVVAAASAVVVTTPGARDLYRQRYPKVPADRFRVIPNGIEDGYLSGPAEVARDRAVADPITLLHSGLMESPDRDPSAFFRALRLLRDRRQLPARPLRVVLRASGNEQLYRRAAREIGVESLVELLPRVSHGDAMKEIAGASGLLLFQGRQCNRQIPAKAYEYLVSRRPIIGLMHPGGDTHALVAKEWSVPYCADMDEPEQIAAMLGQFLADLDARREYVPSPALHERYTRRAHAEVLAKLLDELAPARVVLQE